ncbi:MAG: ATP-dependent helicase [Lachnospiraceae bacterium]|nr:ATP-dependent helicase [Lachnospiraceae bacterium]
MPLNNCNEAQLRAVKHFKGPMLLTAGPGSGKTFTIVERIRYLIEQYQVEPSNILVITFTKAAALEMEQRFSKAVKDNNYPVNFGTFHAVFFHILKQAYQYNSNNIITEKEKREYLSYALEGIKNKEKENLSEQLLSEFGKVKNSIGGIENYRFENGYMEPEEFSYVYKKYRKLCMERRKMDFDDMALQCLELFCKRKDILEKWQRRFPFIMIDEFQDINAVQYAVMRFLAGEEKNILAVGDDDQSIYGFRGANPMIMQKFLTDFPNTSQVVLDKNYRSGKKIVETAMDIIKENQNRIPKIIKTGTDREGRVSLNVFQDKEKEYEEIIKKLKKYQQNKQLNQCAVILRTNQGTAYMKRLLQKEEIPFVSHERRSIFFEHFIMRDMEDYILFAKGERTRERFFHIMNKPSRFISRESIGNGNVDFNKIRQYYNENLKMAHTIERLEKDIEMLKEMPPFLAINYIRKAMRYDDYLKELKLKGIGKTTENYEEIIECIQKDAADYRSIEAWLLSIEERRNSNEKVCSNNAEKDEITDEVCVITMHGAKGLEFETVFLPDLNEGTVPYGKMLSKEEEEEERRIFYVAVTRAKENLELFYIDNEREKPSRFLKNNKTIPKKKPS